MLRVGIGFDAHRFVAGSGFSLGGVWVPHGYGVEAHSDGDVLLHALIDALLGAAALGDIGRHYPDSEPRFENISSRILLQETFDKIAQAGYRMLQMDSVIVCQQPRISPYAEAIAQQIGADCQLPMTAVNIKASTTEGMGFTGRSEGITAQVIALLSCVS